MAKALLPTSTKSKIFLNIFIDHSLYEIGYISEVINYCILLLEEMGVNLAFKVVNCNNLLLESQL